MFLHLSMLIVEIYACLLLLWIWPPPLMDFFHNLWHFFLWMLPLLTAYLSSTSYSFISSPAPFFTLLHFKNIITITALNQIAEQSITCLIHYFHPEMFHLHAPPGDPEHHHDEQPFHDQEGEGWKGWPTPVNLDSLHFFSTPNSTDFHQVIRPRTSEKIQIWFEGRVPQKFFCTYWKPCSETWRMVD